MSLLALAPLVSSGAAAAQLIASPRHNFDVAVNGMASLCPALVGGGSIPDAAASIPFGLRPISAPAGEHHFESSFADGRLEVRFSPAQHMCIVHYGGPGFRAIAGVARDLAAQNGFAPVLNDARDGSQGDVFDRMSGDPLRRQRYIVVESSRTQTAAVSYSERINP